MIRHQRHSHQPIIDTEQWANLRENYLSLISLLWDQGKILVSLKKYLDLSVKWWSCDSWIHSALWALPSVTPAWTTTCFAQLHKTKAIIAKHLKHSLSHQYFHLSYPMMNIFRRQKHYAPMIRHQMPCWLLIFCVKPFSFTKLE